MAHVQRAVDIDAKGKLLVPGMKRSMVETRKEGKKDLTRLRVD